MKLSCSLTACVLIASLSIQGCGSSPKSTTEIPPPPKGVSEELHKRCHYQGVNAGQRAIADMSDGAETFSLLTGGLGAILALGAAEGVRDSAYKDAYDTCLKNGQNQENNAL